MKKKISLILKTTILIFCSLIMISCATQKKQKKNTNTFNEISFGNGGGFTGLTNEYLLKNNGKIFKINNRIPFKINQISSTELQDMVSFIKKVDFQNLLFSETGNITYFIQIKSDTYTNKVSWTDLSDTPDLKEFYKILISKLKQK